MNKLFFPQGTLHIDDNQPVREIAFSICGGRKPAAGWLQMTAEKLPGTLCCGQRVKLLSCRPVLSR